MARKKKADTQKDGELLKQTRYNISTVMPARMQAAYKAALENPDNISLNDEIALVTALIVDRLSTIDVGQTDENWQRSRVLWTDCNECLKANDLPQFVGLFRELGALINKSIADWQAWETVLSTIEYKRRLTMAERGRIKDMAEFVTSQQLNDVVNFILESVKRNVSNPEERAAIANDCAAALSPQGI